MARSVKEWTVGGIVSFLVVAIPIWTFFDPWPWAGWTTPNQHGADIEMVQDRTTISEEKILEAIGALSKQQTLNHLAWKCDEWEEELLEKLREQRGGDDSVELAHDIAKLRDRLSDNDCDQFDD